MSAVPSALADVDEAARSNGSVDRTDRWNGVDAERLGRSWRT